MTDKRDKDKEKSFIERIDDYFGNTWGKYAMLMLLVACTALGYKNRNRINLSSISGNNNNPIIGSTVITNNINQSDNRSFNNSDNRKFNLDMSDNSVTNITNSK
eukprot:349412_1